MTHEYCGQDSLESAKYIFQGMGEDLTEYSNEIYARGVERGLSHKETLEAIKESLQGRIDSYNEAKHYIEEVCHQSTAGIDKASDLAHQVIAVPEFGTIAMGIAAVGTAIALYLGRNKLFGDKTGDIT